MTFCERGSITCIIQFGWEYFKYRKAFGYIEQWNDNNPEKKKLTAEGCVRLLRHYTWGNIQYVSFGNGCKVVAPILLQMLTFRGHSNNKAGSRINQSACRRHISTQYIVEIWEVCMSTHLQPSTLAHQPLRSIGMCWCLCALTEKSKSSLAWQKTSYVISWQHSTKELGTRKKS